MVPKESAFNQSIAASGMCARKAWRFPGSTASVRDGKLVNAAFLPSRLKFRFCLSTVSTIMIIL